MVSNERYYVESNGLYQAVKLGIWLSYLWCYPFEQIDHDFVVHLGYDNIDDDRKEYNDSYNECYFG